MSKGLAESQTTVDSLCINTIRTLCMDAVQKANSGHPGAPMGLAPAGYVLWTRFLKHNPADPHWLDRDRFILSGGHASTLLYSLLHLTGYDLTLDDLKEFRQWGGKTPGHPEYRQTPGVETTTGPLGQGIANAVGMAMAERHLAARFNREGHEIVDHHTYVMCGDGDLMEGISSEAVSLAGHLGLSRLICLYDDNRISIEGGTDLTFTEDVAQRFASCGWHVVKVADGNEPDAIDRAIREAKAETGRPSILMLRTHIAYGSPNLQGSCDAHGAPLGVDEVRLTKEALCCEPGDFCVPDLSLAVFRKSVEAGREAQGAWEARFKAYREAHPGLAKEWDSAMKGSLPEGWEADIPDFGEAGSSMATRVASGKVLNGLAGRIPTLIGGSADLAPSNKTLITGSHDFQKGAYDGRNIRFGVREHAMAGILSGMALHNGTRPYGGTFLVFADYMRPAIRLAALMKLPVIYVFTHDSLAVGEDGPTHQPVEHLASLRMIHGLTVIRPADAAETAEAWKVAMESTSGPVALLFSRQNLPILDRTRFAPAERLRNGAYILRDTDGEPDIILIATGSEVHITLDAAAQLRERGVAARVVSMPCWELFEKMPAAYRESVLPASVPARLSVEAGIPMGWSAYVGPGGESIGITGFGVSAPGKLVMERMGFTSENVVGRATALLNRLKGSKR